LAGPIGVTFSAEHNAIIGTLTLGPQAISEIQYAVRVADLPAAALPATFSTQACLHTGVWEYPPTNCYAKSNALKFYVLGARHQVFLPFISR